MFRVDLLWLMPAVLLALYQVKIVWGSLDKYSQQETDIPGEYTWSDWVKFDYFTYLTYFLLLFQLVFPLLSITQAKPMALLILSLGYVLVLSGLGISLKALKDLGSNWSGMNQYRIVKGQFLVTKGIYRYIRHPIYLAVIIELVGFELIANSYLFLLFLTAGSWIILRHVKKEESLLELKYGSQFLKYKKNTKMMIPYVF